MLVSALPARTPVRAEEPSTPDGAAGLTETAEPEVEQDPAEGQAPDPEPLPPAEDITMACALNGYVGDEHPTKMRDNAYKSYWESPLQNGERYLTVTAPEGKTVGAILIRWASWPVAVDVQERRDGEWVTVATCDADFVAQYMEIPGLSEFRIIGSDNPMETKLKISEITIMTPGALPEDFQIWQKAPEKVDMLLIAGHPDDEVLWFGGLLPTYAGEQGKDVLVACGAHNSYFRCLELCDCLWACGVRIYPEFMHYGDYGYANLVDIYAAWGGHTKVQGDVVRLYRRYKPDVVVLQAVNGETGHGAHRILSQNGRDAVPLAASAEEYPESAELYGTWLVPKVYVHLWEENQITMDWHVPLERFGGLDGMEVAAIGFDKHVSQRDKSYYSIHDGGETDCSLFGLYHTTVGPDVEKSDMFEHIPPREE